VEASGQVFCDAVPLFGAQLIDGDPAITPDILSVDDLA
jgi:hypothetical protein